MWAWQLELGGSSTWPPRPSGRCESDRRRKTKPDAKREGLPVRAIQADIENWTIDESYDTIVVIGLLMFFRQETALKLLTAVQEHVKPGGRAIVNVLIEGMTYLGMFDPDNYCLFRCNELEERFVGWHILESRTQTFLAPEDTRKDFATLIAEKPSQKS
jgi:tellurite methyltransferase